MYHETYFRPPVAYNAVRLTKAEAELDSEFFGKDTSIIEEDTEAEEKTIIDRVRRSGRRAYYVLFNRQFRPSFGLPLTHGIAQRLGGDLSGVGKPLPAPDQQ